MGAPGCPTPSKKAYTTARDAKRHMWGLWRKSKQADKVLNHVYRCPCGLFHVGHYKKRKASK